MVYQGQGREKVPLLVKRKRQPPVDAIFDTQWGDFSIHERKHSIYDPLRIYVLILQNRSNSCVPNTIVFRYSNIS